LTPSTATRSGAAVPLGSRAGVGTATATPTPYSHDVRRDTCAPPRSASGRSGTR
jgi:hypothetical protein